MYRCLAALIVLFSLCSCMSGREKKANYIAYYDEEKTKKRAEGNIYNREETGEWTFYAEEGYVDQKGSYDNGLLVGEWKYRIPNIDSVMVWKPIDLDTINFSLPSSFRTFMPVSDAFVYRDTLNGTLLAINILQNCDSNCVGQFYKDNRQAFENGVELQFSQSNLVESETGSFYIDEYDYRRADYQKEVKQYMVYKNVGNNELLVLSMVNDKEYEQQTKFLIGEIFYHFKYKHKRIAFPYEEITQLSNVGQYK